MRIVIAVIALLCGTADAQQVNRCMSPDGKLSFTKGPCPQGTEGRPNVPSPRPPEATEERLIVRPVPITPQEQAREAARLRAEAKAEDRQAKAAERTKQAADRAHQRAERERVDAARERTQRDIERAAKMQPRDLPAGYGAHIPPAPPPPPPSLSPPPPQVIYAPPPPPRTMTCMPMGPHMQHCF